MDKTKIDLNAPAFGPGSQKLDELAQDTNLTPVGEQQGHQVEEEGIAVEPEGETQVPYSRFKKFHDKALESEREAEMWRQRAEELEQSRYSNARSDNNESTEMPSYWVELYGDSEASQKAWKIQQRREEEIEQRAYEAGQRGAQELEYRQREVINSNVVTIDENFDYLSDVIGRDLTAKEQSAILDIVDDYTAKDSDGNYLGEIMPFDKAWEIYELKQNTSTLSKRRDRDEVASLSANPSQGDADFQKEQNRNFNPFERGSRRKRL